ncbi:MAG: HNH endonuclease [Dehalococcoidia bacterium]|nr:HNH endonuclease [Dehalococcoidia bacterium]
MDRVVQTAVLVLNQNYEPLNVCNARRAFVLVDRGKAEVLEHKDDSFIITPTRPFCVPSVIRLVYLIRRPRPQRKLTRRELFQRDNYTCQYCGKLTRDLTIDHVVPRFRGGPHTWDNLVSACKACNHRKAARTPEEARMKLKAPPTMPSASGYYVVAQHIALRYEWHKFIPEWELDRLLGPCTPWSEDFSERR